MGLKSKAAGTREYGLDDELNFGAFCGCTVREIIDDDEWRILEWYCENIEWFFLDNEAYNYMSRSING